MLHAVKIDPTDSVSSDEGAAHRELERWIYRHGSSAVGAAYGRMNLHNVYGNGQQVAGLDEAGKLDVLSRLTAFSNSDSGRTQVTVQAGDTLRSIAQRIYGNGNLWYVIAEANALTDEDTLAAGITLTAPEVKTSSNDANTFKPYNPGEIAGPTSPGLPYIEPPDKGCGTLGMIIMAVVIIVVTVYTAGAATAAVGGTMATGASAGTMALGGAALTGGTTLSALGAVTVGAVSGAAGALAGQAVGSTMGVASFSWRNVAAGAVTGALTAGLASTGAIGRVADALGGSRFVQGAVGAVASNLVSQAGNRIAGIDTSFSWRSIATSAVTAGLTASAMPMIGKAFKIDLATQGGQRIADKVGGTVGGIVGLHVRRQFGIGGDVDYRQIVTDAFGNMLGNAASGKHEQWASEYAAKVPVGATGWVGESGYRDAATGSWEPSTDYLIGSGLDAYEASMRGNSSPIRGAALQEIQYDPTATTLDTLTVYPDWGRNYSSFAEWNWRMDYNAWVGGSSSYAKIPVGASSQQAKAIYYGNNANWHQTNNPEGYVRAMRGPQTTTSGVGYTLSGGEKTFLRVIGGTVGVAKSLYEGGVGLLGLAKDVVLAGQVGMVASHMLGRDDVHQAAVGRLGAVAKGTWNFVSQDGRISKVINHFGDRFDYAASLDAQGDGYSIFRGAMENSSAVFDLGMVVTGTAGVAKTAGVGALRGAAAISDTASAVRSVMRMEASDLGYLEAPQGSARAGVLDDVVRGSSIDVVANNSVRSTGRLPEGINPVPQGKFDLWHGYLSKRGVRFEIGTERAYAKLAENDAVGLFEKSYNWELNQFEPTIYLQKNPNASVFYEEGLHALDYLKGRPFNMLEWEYRAKTTLLDAAPKRFTYEEFRILEQDLELVKQGRY